MTARRPSFVVMSARFFRPVTYIVTKKARLGA